MPETPLARLIPAYVKKKNLKFHPGGRNRGASPPDPPKGRITQITESPTPPCFRARPSQCANPEQPDHTRLWHGGDIARAHGPRIVETDLTVVDLGATVGIEVPRAKRKARTQYRTSKRRIGYW